MKEFANNSTNEDLIEFAKEQCEIFPEDSYMGKYLRETLKILDRILTESSEATMWISYEILLEEIKQAREEIESNKNTTSLLDYARFYNKGLDMALAILDKLIEEVEG